MFQSQSKYEHHQGTEHPVTRARFDFGVLLLLSMQRHLGMLCDVCHCLEVALYHDLTVTGESNPYNFFQQIPMLVTVLEMRFLYLVGQCVNLVHLVGLLCF